MKAIIVLILITLLFCSCQSPGSSAFKEGELASNSELRGGYNDLQLNMKTQTWFGTPGDRYLLPFTTEREISNRQYMRWSRNQSTPHVNNIAVDFMFLPEMYQKRGASLYAVENYCNIDGTPVRLFSSLDPVIIKTDLENMAKAGVKTVTPQIFLVGNKEDMERDFAILRMYLEYAPVYNLKVKAELDITGVQEMYLFRKIRLFWQELNNRFNLYNSAWERIDGKPAIAIWGLGFFDRNGKPEQAAGIINWLKGGATNPAHAYVEGGVPFYWSWEAYDSKPGFLQVYLMFDTISPWTVGRFNNTNFDKYKGMLKDQYELCRSHGIKYQPIMWPGFSWHNLVKREFPKTRYYSRSRDSSEPYFVPRECGQFIWEQFRFYKELGINDYSYAMWNEDNEGTAFFSHQTDQNKLPHCMFVPDKGKTSPDFYRRLIGEINKWYAHSDIGKVPVKMPVPLK